MVACNNRNPILFDWNHFQVTNTSLSIHLFLRVDGLLEVI